MNATRRRRADRPARSSSTARTGSTSRPSCPTSRSSAPPPPTSAATSPTSMRAAISARSTRRWRSATMAASSSRRSSASPRAARLKPHRRPRAGHPGRRHRRRAGPDADDADRLRAGHLAARSSARCRASRPPEFGVDKVIARRVAQELRVWRGGQHRLRHLRQRAAHPASRKGRHGDVTWVIEQGAVGGVPLLDFQFGCASNAEAIVPSPYQFTYFQGGGFDASLLSFLQIDRRRLASTSPSSACARMSPPAPAASSTSPPAPGGSSSPAIFTAAAGLAIEDGALVIAKEGKVRKLVDGGRARLLLRPARGRAGPGHHLRHRALRPRADAGRASS